MVKVHVVRTSSGYLPTTTWGSDDSMERQAYAMPYQDLAQAERVARGWAEEQGGEYVPFQPIDADAARTHALLVKRLRDEEGLDLRSAVAKARALAAG